MESVKNKPRFVLSPSMAFRVCVRPYMDSPTTVSNVVITPESRISKTFLRIDKFNIILLKDNDIIHNRIM